MYESHVDVYYINYLILRISPSSIIDDDSRHRIEALMMTASTAYTTLVKLHTARHPTTCAYSLPAP